QAGEESQRREGGDVGPASLRRKGRDVEAAGEDASGKQAESRAQEREEKKEESFTEAPLRAVVGDLVALRAEPDHQGSQAEEGEGGGERRNPGVDLALAAHLRDRARSGGAHHVALADDHLAAMDLVEHLTGARRRRLAA